MQLSRGWVMRVSVQKSGNHPFLFFKNLFIYFWLRWVFVSVRGLSLVAASGGHSSLRCAGLSLSRPLLLRSTGSRHAGSVVVEHGPSCSAACGIFPDQGSNPCPLHWQADSQPLHHQGSPHPFLLNRVKQWFSITWRGLLKQFSGPASRVSDSASLRQGLRIYISNKLPKPHLENH